MIDYSDTKASDVNFCTFYNKFDRIVQKVRFLFLNLNICFEFLKVLSP